MRRCPRAALAALLLHGPGVLAEDAPATAGANPPAVGGEEAALSGAPRVVVETAYRAGARPRAEGAVVASVADEELARWNTGGTAHPDHVANRAGYHVAARVLVTTKVVAGRVPERSRKRGVLSRQAVLARTRDRGYWPIRLCYEASLQRQADLRGALVVRFSIQPTGRVSATRVVSSSAPLRPVAACVAEKLRQITYAPAPRSRTDVEASVELSPGDAPLPPLDAEPVATGGGTAGPTALWAAPAAAELALRPPVAEIARCFGVAVSRDPHLWGRLALRLQLDEDGRVVRAAEADSRFPESAVAACAREALKGLQLPPPLGGAAEAVWALRLGQPPRKGAAETAEIVAPGGRPQRTVAEPPGLRVRVIP